MATISVKLEQGIKASCTPTATIYSKQLLMTWVVTQSSFDAIHSIHHIIETIPEKLQTISQMYRSNVTEATTFMNLLKQQLARHMGLKEENVEAGTQLQSYTFNTTVQPIYTLDVTATHKQISFNDSVGIIIQALDEVQEFLESKDYTFFEAQYNTLMHILTIQKTFCVIYEIFVWEILTFPKSIEHFRKDSLERNYSIVNRSISSLPQHFCQAVRSRLCNAMDVYPVSEALLLRSQ